MKRRLFPLVLAMLLMLTGCGVKYDTDEDLLCVAATTYPVFLLAQAVAAGAEDVSLSLIIDQEVSCLHDYTLTMRDMTAIERADIILINGAGLEDFLSDALAGRTAVDCSVDVSLRVGSDGETDPHIWMDPRNAAIMAKTIAEGLSAADPDNAELYRVNAAGVDDELTTFRTEMLDLLGDGTYNLITFHDGFRYFAESFDLNLLTDVEEEEGGEASAKTIQSVVSLVREYDVPVIFTERNGSDSTALAIGRECGTATRSLDMCMSGDGGGLTAYESVMRENIETIREAFS